MYKKKCFNINLILIYKLVINSLYTTFQNFGVSKILYIF